MERPCRKRKSASTPNEALPAGSSTPQAAPSEATRQSAKANKKRKTRNAAVTEEVDLDAVGFEELHPATIFKTPKNPRATLEGLPAELRLEIYKHLSDSSLVHVHRGTQGKEKLSPRFTWTPCRLPSSKTPLLCANPEWSGMCKEQDRCTYEPCASTLRGPWALAASNKAIRNESQSFFLRISVVSVDWLDLQLWLEYLTKHAPQHMMYLRRITLAGRNQWSSEPQSLVPLLLKYVPKLEGLGYQWHGYGFLHDPEVLPSTPKLFTFYSSNELEVVRCKEHLVNNLISHFESPVTFALETIIWEHPRANRHLAIRMFSRENTCDDDDSDVDADVEIDAPEKFVQPKPASSERWWKVWEAAYEGEDSANKDR